MSARVARIRNSSRWACANSAAKSNRSSPECSPSTACAMASTVGSGTNGKGRERPCRYAFRLDARLPSAVLGPVLRLALARLAAICFSLAIGSAPLLRAGSPRLGAGSGIIVGPLLAVGAPLRLFAPALLPLVLLEQPLELNR